MKSYRVKFIAMTLAVGILFTSVMAYASTETADVNAYKDYIAMELNAELFDSMGAENGVFPEEYAGAYIDDSGNYHVCITEADAQPVFEAVLNEDTTSAIVSEATEGAPLGRRAINEINSVEVQYDIKQFSYEYLKSIQNVLTKRMEELGIHRIGIKQKDNVVDVYMNSDATEEINDYLHQNIENFDTMAVRVHVDDPEMDFVTAKTVSIDISAYATDEVSIDEEEMLQAISALDESFQNGDVVVGGICYFMPAAAPETVIALGFV